MNTTAAPPAQQESTRQEIRRWLLMLRDDYHDEVPRRIIHSTEPDNKYKVRNAWWQMLVLALQRAVRHRLFSPAFADATSGFVQRTVSEEFCDRLKTPEDIALGNHFIRDALRELASADYPSIAR